MVQTLIILFYLLLYFLSFRRYNAAVFLFVLFLVIQNQFNFVLPSNVIFSFIIIFHGIFNKKVSKYIRSNIYATKNIIRFLIAFLLITLVNEVRSKEILSTNGVIDNAFQFIDFITYFFGLIVETGAFYIIFLSSSYPKNRVMIYNGIIYSALLLCITAPFSYHLNALGFNTQILAVYENHLMSFSNQGRVAGLFNGGDINSFGAYIAISTAILFSYKFITHELIRTKELIFLIIFTFGILFSASRMSLGLFVFAMTYGLYLYYTHTKKSSSSQIKFVISLILLAFAYNFLIGIPRLSLVFERIQDQGILTEIRDGGSRNTRWLNFINFSLQDWKRFFFGTSDIYYAFGNRQWYDPHNYFIRGLFFSGFLVTFYFLYSFLLYIKYILRYTKSKLIYPILLMVFVSIMIISQSVAITTFFLYSSFFYAQQEYRVL